MKTTFNIDAAQKNILGFQIHFMAFLFLTPATWLVWSLTNTTYPWPLWPTPVWAIGVLFHYLGVFVFRNKNRKTF